MNTTPNPAVLAMAKEIRPQVFTVIVAKERGGDAIVGSGSGFVINRRANGNCVLLTCDHVIRGEVGFYPQTDRIFVRRMLVAGGVQQLPAELLYTDYSADLSILEVLAPMQGAQPLTFAPASTVAIGNTTIAVGYCTPQVYLNRTEFTRTPAVSPGVLKSLRTDASGTPIRAVLSCVGMQGMSGGPVMCTGGVLAVVSSGDYIKATGRHVETYGITSEKVEQDVWSLNELVKLM